MTSFYIKIYLF